jgi:hypothetical protein
MRSYYRFMILLLTIVFDASDFSVKPNCRRNIYRGKERLDLMTKGLCVTPQKPMQNCGKRIVVLRQSAKSVGN